MRVAVMTAPGEVGVQDYAEPNIVKPTDAIIALSASCICGSDLWPYRGVEALDGPRPMGHEYCGIVEEVGSAVITVKPGTVRRWLVLRLRQHLRDLPLRLPTLCSPRIVGVFVLFLILAVVNQGLWLSWAILVPDIGTQIVATVTGTITVFNLTWWSLRILGLRPLLTTRPWTPVRRSRFSAVHHPTQGNDLREARSKEHPCPT